MTPEQVLVVANGRIEESVELARYYAESRSIPERNVVILQCPTSYNATRLDYQRQIYTPLREIMVQRDLTGHIRCLALLRGVPIRVLAPVSTPVERVYRTAALKAHARLATVYQLLPTVGEAFPSPRTEGLRPLGALFSQPGPVLKEPFLDFDVLQRDVEFLLTEKHKAATALPDPDQRQIALRQIMAIHLDTGGMKGLIGYIRGNTPAGTADLSDLNHRVVEAQAALDALGEQDTTPADAERRMELLNTLGGSQATYAYVASQLGPAAIARTSGEKPTPAQAAMESADAAVDSELSLLLCPPYDLAGPWPNPLHWRQEVAVSSGHPPMLMTARIDGPTFQDARRIVTDSIAVEKTGLTGIFYIDAGGKLQEYDERLSKLHDFVRTRTQMPVILDRQREVFPVGSCPDAALYVGWYSLQRYVPAFEWTRGAVGWHIASFEAAHLRKPESEEWCVKMLQHGVAATLGAVDEPLLGTFPLPDEFFPLLLTGRYTLAECYWRTTPTTSWRMTLIGDPLYRPFAANPQVKVDALPAGLAPAEMPQPTSRPHP